MHASWKLNRKLINFTEQVLGKGIWAYTDFYQKLAWSVSVFANKSTSHTKLVNFIHVSEDGNLLILLWPTTGTMILPGCYQITPKHWDTTVLKIIVVVVTVRLLVQYMAPANLIKVVVTSYLLHLITVIMVFSFILLFIIRPHIPESKMARWFKYWPLPWHDQLGYCMHPCKPL